MTAGDIVAVGAWLATVGLMVWLAWEPWRRTRRMVGLELPGDPGDRVRGPLFVFAPAAGLLALPFVVQLPNAGQGVWAHPHLLMPFGLVVLAAFVAMQLGFRRAFLRVAQAREAASDQRRAIFERGAARSARQARR